MPPRRKRPVSDKSDAPRVVCLFFDLHGDFRMTRKTNVPPREAAAPSIVRVQVLRWLKLPQNCPLLPPLKQAYSAAAQQSLFAIRNKDGHLIEASMWCRSGVICCEARAGQCQI